MSDSISTSGLLRLRSAGTISIVDARPASSYNGWAAPGRRPGHIQGARSLSAEWIDLEGWDSELNRKSIPTEAPTVVYGIESGRVQRVAVALEAAGLNVKCCYDFSDEWRADPRLPMEFLPGYRRLVSPQWVKESTARRAEDDSSRDIVICHVHFDTLQSFKSGHIPNAVLLDTRDLEEPPTWKRRSTNEITRTLAAAGIDRGTTVVIYGSDRSDAAGTASDSHGAGQLAAFRSAFLLSCAGVMDVRILDGGMSAWRRAGFPVETANATDISNPQAPPRRHPDSNRTADAEVGPGLAYSADDIRRVLLAPDGNLVSVRSRREYAGEVGGYVGVKRKGHIPGAILAASGSDANNTEHLRALDQTVREFHEIAALWAEAGVTPDKENVFYCGTGWRASEAWFIAMLSGWKRIGVYDGGWFDWIGDATNPVAVGV